MNAAIMAIVAIVTVGVALAGVILTSARLVLDACHRLTRGVCRT